MVKKENKTPRLFTSSEEESFLFYYLPLYSHSYQRQLRNPEKIYVADQAFFNQMAFSVSTNFGRVLENVVFMELKRRNSDIFYHRGKDKKEVDFVQRERNKIVGLIQVTQDLENQKTREREIDSLLAGMDEYGLKKGLILTLEDEAEFAQNGRKIKIMPIYRWLLEGMAK